MSATPDFVPEKPGIVVPDDGSKQDTMGDLAHAVLDDTIYNIIFDIVLETHRDEKAARAETAVMLVEKLAAQTDPNKSAQSLAVDGPSQPHHAETKAAIYDDGEVYLKGNPMETITEIICKKCGLPRLLYPTDGKGARTPIAGVEYCKKQPYIEKQHLDIYGQFFQEEGPGKGKKKQIHPIIAEFRRTMSKEGTPYESQDSPPPGSENTPLPNEPKPINMPTAKCAKCDRSMAINRFNSHLSRCLGDNGRVSSRKAQDKMRDINGGSQNGQTPNTSRHSTPVPNGTQSSSKREATDELDSDTSPPKKKKKPVPKTGKPIIKLKAPSMTKKVSQHSASALSFESKPPQSEDEEGIEIDEDGDDYHDGDFGGKSVGMSVNKKASKINAAVPLKKKTMITFPSKSKPQKKLLFGERPSLPPDVKLKMSKEKLNGKNERQPNGKAEAVFDDDRRDSISSQTLSSPTG